MIDRPALSVVVPVGDGGPSLPDALAAVAQQTRAAGGEVLVSASESAELPPEGLPEGVGILRLRSRNILELRAAGIAAARGEVVALIEDHVMAAPGWVAATLRAHARHPQTAVIGGAIDNGSRGRLVDWANFLMTFGAFLTPITAGERARAPAIANLSIKRAALPSAPLTGGELEFRLLGQFTVEKRVTFDDDTVVWHVQSDGAASTIWRHFCNGRMTGGARSTEERRAVGSPRQCLRRLHALASDAWVTVSDKPLPLRARASLPLMLVLCAAHVSGEWVGAARGPGRSAEALS